DEFLTMKLAQRFLVLSNIRYVATSSAKSSTEDHYRQRAMYAYFLPIQTRWQDNDQYGHVNNAAYYSYFDTIINHFLISLREQMGKLSCKEVAEVISGPKVDLNVSVDQAARIQEDRMMMKSVKQLSDILGLLIQVRKFFVRPSSLQISLTESGTMDMRLFPPCLPLDCESSNQWKQQNCRKEIEDGSFRTGDKQQSLGKESRNILGEEYRNYKEMTPLPK
ncbi:unnamed protein product, partial [Lepidochelys olivacea]